MALQHFILTRFNVASEGREAKIRGRPGWLQRRFDLFETYCLPSVAQQSHRDFEWLIYFDASTSVEHKERLARLQTQFPFQTMFVEKFDAQLAKQDVAMQLRQDTDRVLTTRLDNDDAIAQNFVQLVQTKAEHSDLGTLISFTSGYSLRDGQLFEKDETANPFISLVEASTQPQTVWHDQHQNLPVHWPMAMLPTRAWIQLLHNDNVSNRVKGRLVADCVSLANFPVSFAAGLSAPGPWTVLLDRFLKHPFRMAKEHILRFVKAVIR